MVNNKTLTTKLDKEYELTRRIKRTKFVSVFIAKVNFSYPEKGQQLSRY